MTLTSDWLRQRLTDLGAGSARRLIVAYSGGLDSTVLLHLVRTLDLPLLAVHINHGLLPGADQWQEHCRQACAAIGVAFESVAVDVVSGAGGGLEAAAREARYTAFRRIMVNGDCVLTAHHRDDQAETLLLNLMRASGPLGMSGIPAARELGPGRLLRPLLDVAREDLLEFANREGLRWIEDPSNRDVALDRNFLRHEILPRLQSRWPGASGRLERSGELMAEAAGLLDVLAGLDLEAAGADPRRLSLASVRELDDARVRNLLRFSLRAAGLTVPGGRQLSSIVSSVIHARDDAEPLVTWSGGEARRFRDHLFLMPPQAPSGTALAPDPVRASTQRIALGEGLGRLRFEAGSDIGLDPALLQHGLRIGFRRGGETLRVGGRTRPLKKLMQEADILPWMRERIPLLFDGDQLVAVADEWLSESAAVEQGIRVVWEHHPPIR